MNKKIATFALVGVLALGGSVTAYAASTPTVQASTLNAQQRAVVEQSKEANKAGAILKSVQDNDKNEKNSVEKTSKDNDNIQHENQNEDPAGYED